MGKLTNIPEGWRVFWCEICFYSVTFDDATADSYGQDWMAIIESTIPHEHEEII